VSTSTTHASTAFNTQTTKAPTINIGVNTDFHGASCAFIETPTFKTRKVLYALIELLILEMRCPRQTCRHVCSVIGCVPWRSQEKPHLIDNNQEAK
jgi:hypothetical protein